MPISSRLNYFSKKWSARATLRCFPLNYWHYCRHPEPRKLSGKHYWSYQKMHARPTIVRVDFYFDFFYGFVVGDWTQWVYFNTAQFGITHISDTGAKPLYIQHHALNRSEERSYSPKGYVQIYLAKTFIYGTPEVIIGVFRR